MSISVQPALALSWLGSSRAREWAYAAAVAAASIGIVLGLGGLQQSTDPQYAPLSLALMVGLLLTVRLMPGQPGAALVLLPAMAVEARFGLTALPAVAFVAVVANLVRGVRGAWLLSTAGHTVLAYAAGSVAADVIGVVPTWAVFAVVFAGVRFALWYVAQWLDTTPTHPRAERPELLLTLVLAPLGVLPILAADRLGDGALLLASAALLALLFVMREAVNLATLRVETEAERDRLARANALQDDLIHLITHELRNPLTLVTSYAQMVRLAAQDGNVESIPNYINQVERASRSIHRLMENLLQLSKLERSDSLPASEPVDLNTVISFVMADLAPLAKQKQQNVHIEPTADARITHGVPILLREALSNLVSNAVKYTPEGGEITIWTEAGAKPGTVVLGVRDTGIGLSQEDIERLFTKFFRSSDPRVQRERGSGLGLALTHAMVTRMGGAINVSSTLGEGTTFRLTLPSRSG